MSESESRDSSRSMTSHSQDLHVQLTEIVNQLKENRSDVNSLREEVRGNSVAVGNEVKKLKIDIDVVWKRPGNKDLISQSLWAQENSKADYVSDLLTEAVDKLKKRNKLIRIADTSEGGWNTVKQYESNPIASDSNDESKLQKAENRALKRRKTKITKPGTRKPSQSASRSGMFPVQFSSGTAWGGSAPYAYNPVNQFSGRGGKNFRGSQGFHNPIYNQGSSSGIGPCFACGEFTNFRRNCPYTAADSKFDQISAKKMSPRPSKMSIQLILIRLLALNPIRL